MENKRKSISLLGWIIGALLLIYLGVFCYLRGPVDRPLPEARELTKE